MWLGWMLGVASAATPVGPKLADTRPPQLATHVEEAAPSCPTTKLPQGEQLPNIPDVLALRDANKAWGTEATVDLVVQTAEEMAWRLPDADALFVGDVSMRRGGPIRGHRSHQGGRDADIGLYYSHPHDGHLANMTRDLSSSQLDLEANWLLIESLLGSGQVERILMDRTHIRAIRRFATRNDLVSEERARAIFHPEVQPTLWLQTGVVQHHPGHIDHMHIRVECASANAVATNDAKHDAS